MQSADTGSMFSWFGANDLISWIMFAVFTVITFAIVFILASRLKKRTMMLMMSSLGSTADIASKAPAVVNSLTGIGLVNAIKDFKNNGVKIIDATPSQERTETLTVKPKTAK